MGYTVQSTLVYSIILVVAAYLIFKLLKKLGVKIDRMLAVAVSPYVLLGSTIRSLEDAGLLSSLWFVTPGIYFFIFIIVFAIILIGVALEKKRITKYYKFVFVCGIILASIFLSKVNPTNYEGIFLVLAFYSIWPIIFYFLKKWKLENRIVTSVQMFDATTTFVSLNFFGYSEQHVLPTFFIDLFGPLSFIPLKLIAIVTILVLIDKFSDDKEFNSYVKMCIGILGAATGLRDFLSLSALV